MSKVTFSEDGPALAQQYKPLPFFGPEGFFKGIGQTTTDVGRVIGQGLTMGWSDEMVAGARSIFGDEDYEKLLKIERDAIERFRKQNPGTAIATELGASLYVPGAILGNLTRGSLKGAKGVMKSTAAGSGGGAIYGAGASEEGQRSEGAGTGAVVGGVMGPAMTHAVAPAAGYAARRFTPGGKKRQAQHKADKMVLQAAEEDLKYTSPDIYKQLQKAGLPATEYARILLADPVTRGRMLADFQGGYVAGLGQGATSTSRRAYQHAEDNLQGRMQEETFLLQNHAADSMRTTTRATAMADDAADRTSEQAAKLYDKAYNVGASPSGSGPRVAPKMIEMDPLRSFLNNKHMKDAYETIRHNREIAFQVGKLDERFRLPSYDEWIQSPTSSTKLLHEIKQHLDTLAKWGSRDLDAAKSAKPVRDLIHAVNSRVGDQNPWYKLANDRFSVGPRLQEAVVMGAKASRSNAARVRREYHGLETGWERSAYRAGMIEEIFSPFFKNIGRDFAGYLGKNRDLQTRLRATFKDGEEGNKAYREFVRHVDESVLQRRTATSALKSSGTAERQAGQALFGSQGGRILESAAQMGNLKFTDAAMAIIRKMDNRPVADEVANLLYTGSPAATTKALNQLLATNQRLGGMDRVRIHQMIKALTQVAGKKRILGPAAAASGLISQTELADDARNQASLLMQ